jgi:hypothetical protein
MRLGKIRSAGVTDLRFGNVLDEHWQGRNRFEHRHDTRCPLPLPSGMECYARAGTPATRPEQRQDLGPRTGQPSSPLRKAAP